MMTARMSKKLLLLGAVAGALLVAASCARHKSYAPSEGKPSPSKEYPGEFADVPVVNGKPFADMYFKNYGVNPTIDTEEERISTFSIDVDTASYSLARSYLSRGHLPEPDAVRVEEFVNALRYDYPAPTGAPFGVQVEAFPSPNRKGYHVLQVGIRAKDVTAAQRAPANLVFTIDVSGSMNMENRLGLVKRSLALLVDQLDARDSVAIVVYGDSARTVLEPTRATDRARILSAIDALSAEGATNVQDGLRIAYAIAARNAGEGVISRVILCSDGVANNGITDADAIFETVRAEASRGVALTAVGFGMGNYNDVLMERLAQRGDGQYAYVDRLDEARRIFVEQATGTLQVVAKDVKIQLEFDRDRVARYRLIGFENRMLQNADFGDDRVDAGEIGAGHTVTALYEVKFRGEIPAGAFAHLRLRYKAPQGGDSRLVEAPLSTQMVRPSIEQASASARLALVAALFAEKLRGSYWVRNVSYDDILRQQAALPAALRDRQDVAELSGLIRQAKHLDRRADRFEKDHPVSSMDFDHVPVVR